MKCGSNVTSITCTHASYQNYQNKLAVLACLYIVIFFAAYIHTYINGASRYRNPGKRELI